MEQFKILHNRKNTRSVKWDLLGELFNDEDLLPMWIADMDFKSPEEINKAIIKRAKHGFYGYTTIDDDFRKAIISWLERRHHWKVNKKDLSFSPSVITSLHIAITTFTKPGDRIMIQTPVYTPFYDVINRHKREVVTNELLLNEKTNKYEIDFHHFEKMLSKGIKAFILCSPHNPVGRVWNEEELQKMAHLCKQYDVLIFSDEIHADLIYSPYKHRPIASLSSDIAHRTITFMSPTKTFNIAGLHASYTIISNEQLRKKFNQQLKNYNVGSINIMGIYALEAAYNDGEPWLEKLLKTLEENKQFVVKQFKKHLPKVRVIDAEGTYLLWLDFRKLTLEDQELEKILLKKARVALNRGVNYGKEGKKFMRINIACPKELLQKGVSQIIHAFKTIE